MLSFEVVGDWSKTTDFLRSAKELEIWQILERYGKEGVSMLSQNTPVDTGTTADSWDYEIRQSKGRYTIYWTNDNITDGVPVAILIQYGHATKNGGYVMGEDFINPAMVGIFRQFANEIWEEVSSL